jgi:hypothetical protein
MFRSCAHLPVKLPEGCSAAKQGMITRYESGVKGGPLNLDFEHACTADEHDL